MGPQLNHARSKPVGAGAAKKNGSGVGAVGTGSSFSLTFYLGNILSAAKK